MVVGNSSEEKEIATILRLLQCGFDVAQGELNQQPECNSSQSYVQSNPISIDNRAFGSRFSSGISLYFMRWTLKPNEIRVNGQQQLCLSSHGLNPKWPSGSMFYNVQEILRQSFLTVLDSHVIDLFIGPNQKIDCRPLIYMWLLISCIWKSVLLCEVRGGGLNFKVKRLNSSFLSSHPTRI